MISNSFSKKYIEDNISRNKKRYTAMSLTLYFAVLVFATFIIGVLSFYFSYRNYYGSFNSGYHFQIKTPLSAEECNKVRYNRNIKKTGFYYSEIIRDSNYNKPVKLKVMDENSINTIKEFLKTGSLPCRNNEVIISNNEALRLNKKPGDSLTIDNKTYVISGIYFSNSIGNRKYFNIFSYENSDEMLKGNRKLSLFIWYKNIYKTYDISEKIIKSLDIKDLRYSYNYLYLDKNFVNSDADSNVNRLLDNYFLIFIMTALLLYIISKNLFSINENREKDNYLKLEKIGISNKEIGGLIRHKYFSLALIPVITGVLTSNIFVLLIIGRINSITSKYIDREITSDIRLFIRPEINFLSCIIIIILSFLIIGAAIISTEIRIKRKGKIKKTRMDMTYTGNFEKDMADHLYRNKKKNFLAMKVSLWISFIIMAIISVAFSCYKLETEFEKKSKFAFYNITGQVETEKALDEKLVEEIKSLNISGFVNYRKEYVHINNEKTVRLDIYGIEDEIFIKELENLGFDSSKYNENRVVFYNPLKKAFHNKMEVSEYGDDSSDKGYEFTLNIKDRVKEPFLNLPVTKNRCCAYMKRSDYNKLISNFKQYADYNQFEYIAVKTEAENAVADEINMLAEEYYYNRNFEILSENSFLGNYRKNQDIANFLLVFTILFFGAIGISNCYFAVSSERITGKKDIDAYRKIGMDRAMLLRILKREKERLMKLTIPFIPLSIIVMALLSANRIEYFSFSEIMKNINYMFFIAYVLIIYFSVALIYKKTEPDF